MPEILELDPRQISPDPANPRKELRDIDVMCRSIEANGILEPISVRPDGDGRWIVNRGHRRLAGALMAQLPTVPCIVRDDDERERATQAMVENLQRDDLTPIEHARGVQHLLDLGLTPTNVAIGLSVSEDEVFNASTVAQSPVAVAVTEKHDLTFDQALALAEFEDDREAVVALTGIAIQRPEMFDHTVARFRQRRDDERAVEAARSEWREKGVTVLEEKGEAVSLNVLSSPGKDKALNKQTHAKCPGRAVVIQSAWNGEVTIVEVCTDWRANGHENALERPRTASVTATPEQVALKEQQTTQRRIHRAGMEASRAAATVRREFVARLVKRAVPPKGTLRFATTVLLDDRVDSHPAMTEVLTGVKETKRTERTPEAVFAGKLSDKALPLGLLAAVAAYVEASWEPNTWSSTDKDRFGGGPIRAEYLKYLASCGYELSSVEKVVIGKAKPEDVLTEIDELRAERKAAK